MGQHVWHPISSVPMTDNHPLAHRQPADIEGQFPMLHSNSNEDAIRALINAIDQATNLRLAEIQKRNLGARASEIAHQEADEAKRALRTATISFDSAIPATVSTIRRPENAFKLARVRGSLAGMDTPVHVESPRNADATLTDLIGERSDETSASVITSLMSRISISGDGDDEIETNRFIDRKLINTFQEDGHRYATWEFLIYVVLSTSASQESESQETNRPSRTYRTYEFFLVDARPLRTAIQVVAPSPGEIAAAEALYGSDPSLIDTIMGSWFPSLKWFTLTVFRSLLRPCVSNYCIRNQWSTRARAAHRPSCGWEKHDSQGGRVSTTSFRFGGTCRQKSRKPD